MFKYLDAHTHVQFAAFDADRRNVIQRALDAGVRIINVGTQIATSERAIELAGEYADGVWATVGLHPIHANPSFHDAEEITAGSTAELFSNKGEAFDYNIYLRLASSQKVVAIGECGLDYFRIEGDVEEAKRKQRAAFEAQIELAEYVEKPLMIHCRNAFPDLIQTLKHHTHSAKPGIIHFFSGTEEDAEMLLKMGFSFTFGGVVTFARDYDEVIKMIPMDRILSETDAPYVAPVPYRGKRNEPAYVVEVVKKLAEIKGVSTDEMAEQILRNARRVFGLNK